MDAPIILCGLGRMGWRVLAHLQAAGLPVVIIDTTCRADDPRLNGARVVTGDCRRREILEAANVAQARGVVILTANDLANVAAVLMVRSLNPDVRIILRMFNQNLISRLGKTVHNVIGLSTSLLTAPILATTALTGQALGAFRIESGADGMRQVAEVPVPPGSDLCGRSVAEVVGRPGVLLLAHLTAQRTGHYLGDVDRNAPLVAGDRLIICAEPRTVSTLLTGSGVAGDSEPLWAGLVRRLTRVLKRTLAEIDRAVLVCTFVLVFVIIASSLILHLGVDKYSSYPAALLRTVSIMATGADMHEEDYKSGWMKIYVGGLRLAGAALLAAFTAIFTNYLLRARLAGALEMRRIPDGGHVIVCGLGPVGFRVVEVLAALHEPVVVVEMDPNNRFLATTRQLGAAVVLGDCGVAEVLRQANAASARAVVAATNNDLINLEVGLLVRELNPKQRVVLLQSDPQLAQMLREGANVRLAVSVPALAAPAFVAALFGNRVQSVFLVGDRLLAVIDLVIGEEDSSLTGRPVREVAAEYRLVPAAVLSMSGTERPLDALLEVGDRLVAIVALSDLETLLRRQRTGVVS